MPPVKFDVKVLLTPQKYANEIYCDMIRSLRSPIEIIAQNSSPSQSPASTDTIE